MEAVLVTFVFLFFVVPALFMGLAIQILWESMYESIKVAKQSGKYQAMADRAWSNTSLYFSRLVRSILAHARSCKHLWSRGQ